MGKIQDKMIDDLRLRGYSEWTCYKYILYSRKFVQHFMLPPQELGQEEVRSFLLHLQQEKKTGPATQKMAVAAIKFLYVHTLNRPEVVSTIPWPKVPVPLPDILSGTEIESLLDNIHSLKYRAILMTIYAAGLRIGEATSLQSSDIDSERMLIHIRCGKGKKDRYVMLSRRLLSVLRLYWKTYRPTGTLLFPGRDPQKPIVFSYIRRILRKAAKAAGITKRVTPHILRHCFATHLHESGTDIRIIQMLLGHNSIRTTTRYLRVSRSDIGRTVSPLDILGTEKAKVLG